MSIETVGTPELWIGFSLIVLVMLVLDLFVFHRKAHEVRMGEALVMSLVWIGLALVFAVFLYFWLGLESGLAFLTGYLIEKALSIDNLFVFIVIFSYFNVPAKLHHRVLFWGILGAIIMRAIFIFTGAALLQKFHFVIYIFGIFLVYTGIKLCLHRDVEIRPEKNPVLRLFRRSIRAVPDYRGDRFLVSEAGRWFATPLLMVLVVIETSDIVFAVDSIPAIFAITSDPFIVYTSNIFAILGLRALYFLLAGMIGKFHYLKVGLGAVLVFVGLKMLIDDIYEIPIALSLGVVALIIGGAILLSLLYKPCSVVEKTDE